MSNSFFRLIAIFNSLRGILLVFLIKPWRIRKIFGGT